MKAAANKVVTPKPLNLPSMRSEATSSSLSSSASSHHFHSSKDDVSGGGSAAGVSAWARDKDGGDAGMTKVREFAMYEIGMNIATKSECSFYLFHYLRCGCDGF
jgi:hypothetical protein